MDYQIALAPELGISPQEFAEAWDEVQEAREIGSTTLQRSRDESFFDQATMDAMINIGINVGSSVVASVIYDVLKKAFERKGKPPTHTKTTILNKPDGTQLIVIDKEEKASS